MNEMANVRMQAYAQGIKQIMKKHEEQPGKAASAKQQSTGSVLSRTLPALHFNLCVESYFP